MPTLAEELEELSLYDLAIIDCLLCDVPVPTYYEPASAAKFGEHSSRACQPTSHPPTYQHYCYKSRHEQTTPVSAWLPHTAGQVVRNLFGLLKRFLNQTADTAATRIRRLKLR